MKIKSAKPCKDRLEHIRASDPIELMDEIADKREKMGKLERQLRRSCEIKSVWSEAYNDGCTCRINYTTRQVHDRRYVPTRVVVMAQMERSDGVVRKLTHEEAKELLAEETIIASEYYGR